MKSNLNALFERGENFDYLSSKSEDLKSHVSTLHWRLMLLCLVTNNKKQGEKNKNVKRGDELRSGFWVIWLSDAELYRVIPVYLIKLISSK